MKWLQDWGDQTSPSAIADLLRSVVISNQLLLHGAAVLPHFGHSGPIAGCRCVDDGLQLSFLGPGFCRLQSVTLSFPGFQPGNIHDMILPGGLTTWTWSCSTRWSDVFCQPLKLRSNLLKCTGCLHVLQMGCSTGFPPVAQLWCGLGISRVPLSRAVSWSRVGKLVAFYWKPQNVRAPILTFFFQIQEPIIWSNQVGLYLGSHCSVGTCSSCGILAHVWNDQCLVWNLVFLGVLMG